MKRRHLSLLRGGLALLLILATVTCSACTYTPPSTENPIATTTTTATTTTIATSTTTALETPTTTATTTVSILTTTAATSANTETEDIIPEYNGSPFVILNNNLPRFSKSEITTTDFEQYSPLDAAGRCGVALACCGTELMPTDERGSISSIKPSGWVQAQYDNVNGKYLYNRCHLIGWQLSGENANKRNLITGTKYLNVEGMLPFENMVADYIKETGNHVMYRITPHFQGRELLARGVQMEAYSVEDQGEGICFNVYCYNVQPGIRLNYATGESQQISSVKTTSTTTVAAQKPTGTYILNTNTLKIHYPTCGSAKRIKEENRQTYTGTVEDLLARGYSTCGNCF